MKQGSYPEMRVVYIDGLPPSVGEEEIAALLSDCDGVLAIRMVLAFADEPLGVAQVWMRDGGMARKLIAEVNHRRLAGHLLLAYRT